jgi:hypothetical protein
VTGTIAILLLAGGATILRQARLSVIHKQQIAAARGFLVPLLLEAHAYHGGMKPLAALQLLKQVEQRIDRMQDADPETRIEVMNIVAASLLILQDTAGTETIVRKAMLAAAAIDPGHAQSLRARMLVNWVRLSRGQTDEVRREIGLLLADMRRSPRTLPEDIAGALRIRSAVALEESNAAEAESSALEALGMAEKRLGRLHNQAVLSLVDLCYAYESDGKQALALDTCKLARDRALAAYSGQWTHTNVIKAREAYAFALAASGQRDGGIGEMKDAIRDIFSSFGPSSRLEGLALRRLARMQLEAGGAGQALESINRAVSILAEHLNRNSPGFARTLELRGRIFAAAHARLPLAVTP